MFDHYRDYLLLDGSIESKYVPYYLKWSSESPDNDDLYSCRNEEYPRRQKPPRQIGSL